MLRTKDEWLLSVEMALPPKERYTERNLAISARYAHWYLDHPEIFKWAGMAAFASRAAGTAIVLAEMMLAPERLGSWNPMVALHRLAAGQFMLSDLEEIRTGNNNIFRDIAWAHAAYVEGGLPEVDGCACGPDRELLLDGFSMIDRGLLLSGQHADDEEAERLVWAGNIALLRHEQLTVLQPVCDKLSPGGRILASFGSELDFTGEIPADPRCIASFSSYHGYLETLSGLKSVADSTHRWQWIEGCVVPAWMAADRCMTEGSAQRRQLEGIASGEMGLLQRAAIFTGVLLPAP
jgi:hypothetical protein